MNKPGDAVPQQLMYLLIVLTNYTRAYTAKLLDGSNNGFKSMLIISVNQSDLFCQLP